MKLTDLILRMADSGDYILPFDPEMVDCYHDDLSNEDAIKLATEHGIRLDNSQYVERDLVIMHSAFARITVADVRQYLQATDFRRGAHITDEAIDDAFAEIDDGEGLQHDGDELLVYHDDLYYYANVSYAEAEESAT